MPELARPGFQHKRGRRPWRLPPISYTVTSSAAEPAAAATALASGEDRSNFQPVSSWGSNDFAFMKATEGTTFTDPTFAANWARARAEGKVRGAYHFFHPGLSPIDQARFFASTVAAHGLEPGDSVVGDVEITVAEDGSWVVLPQATARQNVLIDYAPPLHAGVVGSSAQLFMDTVHALVGPYRPALVYTDLSIAVTLGACTAYDLWIAFPGSSPPANVRPWRDWRFWQNEFGGGEGGGDRDKFHGTRNDLLLWRSSHSGPPPSPRPRPGGYFTGDEMAFQLPPKGQTLAPPVPRTVTAPDGSEAAPTAFRLSCASPATVDYMLGDSGTWVTVAVDYARTPNGPYTLDGATAIKVRLNAGDKSTDPVSGDFV